MREVRERVFGRVEAQLQWREEGMIVMLVHWGMLPCEGCDSSEVRRGTDSQGERWCIGLAPEGHAGPVGCARGNIPAPFHHPGLD